MVASKYKFFKIFWIVVFALSTIFCYMHALRLLKLYASSKNSSQISATVKNKVLKEKSEAFKTAYYLTFTSSQIDSLYKFRLFYAFTDQLNVGDKLNFTHCKNNKYSTLDGFLNRYGSALFYSCTFAIVSFIGAYFGLKYK